MELEFLKPPRKLFLTSGHVLQASDRGRTPMWSSFYATNTIIYFLKKFSLNNFILLNLDKIKDLVCFQTTCAFKNYFKWVYYYFLLSVNAYVYGNHAKYLAVFGKLRKCLKTVSYAFLDFWKSSLKSLFKYFASFENFLKNS